MYTKPAYSNSKDIKNHYLNRFKEHIKYDNIIQGTYFRLLDNDNWKGCSVSCILNDIHTKYKNTIQDDYRHFNLFETEPIHIPTQLARIIDQIHENQDNIENAQDYTLRLLEAIPVGFKNWKTLLLRIAIMSLEYELQDTINLQKEHSKYFELKDELSTIRTNLKLLKSVLNNKCKQKEIKPWKLICNQVLSDIEIGIKEQIINLIKEQNEN